MRFKLLSIALLATSAANAATPINGWYSSLFGGYAYLPNNINTNGRTDAVFQGGYDAGFSLGYKSNPMRYEGEITYMNADLDQFRFNRFRQTGVTGYSDAVLAMANVYYDFSNILYVLQPFLGIGIGYGWVKDQLNSTGPTGVTRFTARDNVFAYQATAGLTYNFAENYALNLGYRYVGTTTGDHIGKMFQANLVNIGAVYRFDGVRYK